MFIGTYIGSAEIRRSSKAGELPVVWGFSPVSCLQYQTGKCAYLCVLHIYYSANVWDWACACVHSQRSINSVSVATLCYSSFTESYPVNLSELLTVYYPSRQLCSIPDIKTFHIPFTKTKTFGQ